MQPNNYKRAKPSTDDVNDPVRTLRSKTSSVDANLVTPGSAYEINRNVHHSVLDETCAHLKQNNNNKHAVSIIDFII